MNFLEIMAAGGSAIALFAIYMYYRAQGVSMLFGGFRKQRREVQEMRKEMEALRSAREEDREALVEILLSMEEMKQQMRATLASGAAAGKKAETAPEPSEAPYVEQPPPPRVLRAEEEAAAERNRAQNKDA